MGSLLMRFAHEHEHALDIKGLAPYVGKRITCQAAKPLLAQLFRRSHDFANPPTPQQTDMPIHHTSGIRHFSFQWHIYHEGK
jgi:hypothetical protein